MSQREYHKKLVRDKIPEIIKANNHEYETKVLSKKEFERELKKKLLEEAKELVKAPKKELINELSDILELIKSIASHYKIDFQKVEKYQIEKREKRGGFKKKLFLIWSTKQN